MIGTVNIMITGFTDCCFFFSMGFSQLNNGEFDLNVACGTSVPV